MPLRGRYREFPQHLIECRLDPNNERGLVREFLVAVMHQHRGIYLEHNKIAGTIEPAIDTEIFKTDALTDRAQYPVMLGIENCSGGGQQNRPPPPPPLVISPRLVVLPPLSLAPVRRARSPKTHLPDTD